ncbi:MAG: TraB/GumN family protein [Lysobacteraceae bacterium]
MRMAPLACLLLLYVSTALAVPMDDTAQTTTTQAGTSVHNLETLVVSGAQPGPGMWKVSKGEHVVWVLGVLSPLPKKMEWQAPKVKSVLRQADEVIWPATLGFTVKVNPLQGLLLLPSVPGARKNPDGKQLRDVVSAQDYQRWLELKARYIGRDRSIESWRPLFAAYRLWKKALDASALSETSVIDPLIKRAARERKFVQTHPRNMLVITDARVALKEFKHDDVDDDACFSKTLDRLETDVASMRQRANAWAIGDLAALRALPYDDQYSTCGQAAMQSPVFRKRMPGDPIVKAHQLWLDAVEKALANNQVTFAMLTMRQALSSNGPLAKLQAKGYLVEAPTPVALPAPVAPSDSTPH